MASKFFRVATEGATTDGRTIQRSWIEQCAKNFNRQKYGARLWLEHFRGMLPDSPFKAYGDVLAVKTEEVDGKLTLLAQIEPLPELMAMNKAKQKIYTSCEIDPSFGDTKEAYLVGLAVTDSPASLGTEVLSFAAQNPAANPFAGRKTNPNTLYSAGMEVDSALMANQDEDKGTDTDKAVNSVLGKFTAAMEGVLAKFSKAPESKPETKPDTPVDPTELVKQFSAATGDAMKDLATTLGDQLKALQTQHTELATKFNTLHAQLDKTPTGNFNRPPATGGGDNFFKATDC
ncbi:GPO family capsid scaffolding protein [Limnohabitans sp. WS1]|uniref:GPO family capsid scaffolding protein n=1 Tax=Limnohabitans sp. WS1 TaxID=1100726 RepID=UPI000D3D76BE|nr:GPO family capsid scaffolding protein [Limnohabitans sp. WS1]PUE20408.1 hypothetical protein B9Z48_05495 [Limnohabitans sp. WS1]